MEKIIVNDMMCIHCKKRIQEALEKNNIHCEIVLENKIVYVDSISLQKAKEIITSLNYNVD